LGVPEDLSGVLGNWSVPGLYFTRLLSFLSRVALCLAGAFAMASNWYFQSLGNVIGPISSVELRQRAAQGQIDANTMVAKDVPDRWVRADRVTGLIGPPGPHDGARRQAPADDSAADLSSPAPMLSGINISPPPVRKPDAKIFEYKVLTPKDKALGGKLDAERLEEALNAYAREGWRVVAAVAGSIHGVTSATREELVIILER
jgi:hypothetical protein